MAEEKPSIGSTAKVLTEKAKQKIKARLEEYNKTNAPVEEEEPSIVSENMPGTETHEERFPEPSFGNVRPGQTQKSNKARTEFTGLAEFTPGTSYMQNKQIYHTARTRLRYPNSEKTTPLVRGGQRDR